MIAYQPHLILFLFQHNQLWNKIHHTNLLWDYVYTPERMRTVQAILEFCLPKHASHFEEMRLLNIYQQTKALGDAQLNIGVLCALKFHGWGREQDKKDTVGLLESHVSIGLVISAFVFKESDPCHL